MGSLQQKNADMRQRRSARNALHLRPYRSLRDQAYDAIKDRIITCEFKPGECINEASVSALLGLGRTPVHQAIDRLMLEEMVQVIPRKGVIVKPIILQDIMQMIDIRMINETHCARLAAVRAEERHIQSLTNVLDRARSAIGERDVRELMMLDREFHQLLGSASRNHELAEVLRKLNERSLRFWFISFTTPDHHHSFQRQHEAVFDAIRRRDADAAEGAMREHIEAFRKSVARHL
jgi:DNA-binding GntR family transcriptional regulator